MTITEIEVLNLGNNTKAFPHLTKKEIAALKSLKSNGSIIIRKADKGGNTVILNKKDYIAEANRQLRNTRHYKPVSKDSTIVTAKQVTYYINEMCLK